MLWLHCVAKTKRHSHKHLYPHKTYIFSVRKNLSFHIVSVIFTAIMTLGKQALKGSLSEDQEYACCQKGSRIATILFLVCNIQAGVK